MNCPRCGAAMRLKINLNLTLTVGDGGEEKTTTEPQQDTLECHDCFLVLTAVHGAEEDESEA